MVVSLLLAVSACDATNLYVAHDTVVGLNAQVSPDRQQGRFVLGYDRDFISLVPKSVEDDEDSDKRDVMALLSCSELEVDGIFLSRYLDVLVSGEAAIELAKNDSVTDPRLIFDCQRFGSRLPEPDPDNPAGDGQ
ncbi:MAG: hypothetical protein AAGC81_01545 [Pseudomonadota bacterium]